MICAVAIAFGSAIAAPAPNVVAPTPGSPSSDATPAPRDQRLSPEDGMFDDYRAAEQYLFRDAFASDVLARVVVEPSFQTEYAVAVVRRGQDYALFALSPSEHIWSSSNRAHIRIRRCDVPLPDWVAKATLNSWSRLLRAPRSPASFGLDGEFYHFAMTISGTPITGQAWSPDPGAPPGMLVDIAERLAKACWTRSNAPLSAIPALADKLRKAVP